MEIHNGSGVEGAEGDIIDGEVELELPSLLAEGGGFAVGSPMATPENYDQVIKSPIRRQLQLAQVGPLELVPHAGEHG